MFPEKCGQCSARSSNNGHYPAVPQALLPMPAASGPKPGEALSCKHRIVFPRRRGASARHCPERVSFYDKAVKGGFPSPFRSQDDLRIMVETEEFPKEGTMIAEIVFSVNLRPKRWPGRLQPQHRSSGNPNGPESCRPLRNNWFPCWQKERKESQDKIH